MVDLPMLPKVEGWVFYKKFPHYFTDQNIRVCAEVLRDSAIVEGYKGLRLIRVKTLACGCREALFRVTETKKRQACEVRSDRGN